MKKLILLFSLLLVGLTGFILVGQSPPDTEQFVGSEQLPAPEFPTGLDWLNVETPLSMANLRGKVVLLDFWTYGCINCIHMIPILAQLEQKYPDELAVIGVHSAKFDNEGVTENIRQIVQRYELHHPVINDSDFAVWNTYRTYGVNAWPTFVIIDPRGNILAVQSGEIPFEAFDRVISGMVAYFNETDEIDRTPLPVVLEAETRPNTALAFPGKVLADPTGNRLFISDTNHNRIVIADLTTYEVLDVIGNGRAALSDGDYLAASFNKPQGMTLNSENVLYVADVNNHAIRAIDLSQRLVHTIAGTGEQATSRNGTGPAAETALTSPWDVALADNTLYIAMAGPHQLWALTLDNGIIFPLVGNGREGLVDGPFDSARLAQPSDLYYEDGLLYFADSEASAVRVADIREQTVRTVAGPQPAQMDTPTMANEAGLNNLLFEFGDMDGPLGAARLQHVLGVVGDGQGTLYVADTYNNKIKRLNPETTEITTAYGQDSATGGYRDGAGMTAAFDEPGGLDYANGRLYVADTNNHAIRIIDLATDEVSTLIFPNPQMLQIGEQPTLVAGNSALGLQITLEEQMLAAGPGEIVLDITLPEGYKLNGLAPFAADWRSDGDAIQLSSENQMQRILEPDLPLIVPVTLQNGTATLEGDLTVYYCEAINESLCFIEQVQITAPITVGEGQSSQIVLPHAIIPPQMPDLNIGL